MVSINTNSIPQSSKPFSYSLGQRYFWIGLILSLAIAFLGMVWMKHVGGELLITWAIMVFVQAHFLVAYIYYIDVIRVKLPLLRHRLTWALLFLGMMALYYLVAYSWFSAWFPIIVILTAVYFWLHHVENIFFFGEEFSEMFKAYPRPRIHLFLIALLSVWFLAFSVRVNTILFPSWVFWSSFGVFCLLWLVVLKMLIFRKRFITTFLLFPLILLVFTGPFFFKTNAAFREFIHLVILWHAVMWAILYPLRIHLRNTQMLPRSLTHLPPFVLSRYIRITRSSAFHFVVFYFLWNAVIIGLYLLTIKILGASFLDQTVLSSHPFWGYYYFFFWTFAHITFSFFPKRMAT